MTIDEILDRLKRAQGDSEQLVLATVDIAAEDPRLREALEAAAIPHWFDDGILSRLAGTDAAGASSLRERLINLPMVEPFPQHQAWNVHESTRLVLRRKIRRDQWDRFRDLSAKAADCWPGEYTISQVERIFHRLAAEPNLGAGELERTYWKWQRSGQREAIQALGAALDELATFPLMDMARGLVLLISGFIRFTRVPLAQTEKAARQALEMLKANGPDSACADALCLLGQVLETKGNLAAALAEYKEHQRIRERLAAIVPDNPDYQRDLSISHTYVGRVYKAQGRMNDALIEFQAHRRIIENSTARDSANTDWQRSLAVSFAHVGDIYGRRRAD